MEATIWLFLTAGAFGLLKWVMPYLKFPMLQAITVRLVAAMFLAAGTVGAAGWIGAAQDTGIDFANDGGSTTLAAVVGTGAIWIAWVFLAVAWLLCLLPESWFGRDIPDWLSMTGLLLPSLMAKTPGPIGNFFGRFFDGIGQSVTDVIRGWIS